MANSLASPTLPKDWVRLPGSERRPSKDARLIGPADASETFSVSIVLRRRTDGPPLPNFDYYGTTPPGKRMQLTALEFAAKFGAHPEDVRKIVAFAEGAGLKVLSSHPGRRTVVVSGTVAQMSQAFALSLGLFEIKMARGLRQRPHLVTESYRGRDGFVQVPKELAPIIVGVFGLDNRPVGSRAGNPGDPPAAGTITIPQMTQLYNFPIPGPGIGKQTIGIIAPTGGKGGYLKDDIDLYFNSIGATTPTLYPISVDGIKNATVKIPTTADAPAGTNILTFDSLPALFLGNPASITIGGTFYYIPLFLPNSATTIAVELFNPSTLEVLTAFPADVPAGTLVYFNLDQETTQDICIAGSAALGANMAIYFSSDTQVGWVDLINRVIHPDRGDFPRGVYRPSVLSASWAIAPGDDPNGLNYADVKWSTGITPNGLTAMDMAFQDAAAFGITVCIASGDNGATSGMTDGFAHVAAPASDPWVLSVGGTTIGSYRPGPHSKRFLWEEWVWNDTFFVPVKSGATGGGVSDFFALPSYQNTAAVPDSINWQNAPKAHFNKTGRGVPDVAGNASPNSGYLMYSGNQQFVANGTSSSTPLWAALIAIINANLGANVGFINPILYALGPAAFNPINPLWRDPAHPQLAASPDNNTFGAIAGYSAGPGWDACTGLGSPNGNALLTAFQQLTLPAVYVLGGFQSPSILLTDPDSNPPNLPVPIGGVPGGRWDTLLRPGSPYGFSVIVHNDTPAPAENVEVRFWAIPGGLGTDGSLIGTPQTVTIPPYSTFTVTASAPFISAALGQHLCAAVSLYAPGTGCQEQALTALQIPDPGQGGSHACSAWRNTESVKHPGGQKFKIRMGFGKMHSQSTNPIPLRMQYTHIPFHWEQLTPVHEIIGILNAIGADYTMPLYTLPEINRHFPSLDLKTSLAGQEGNRVEETGLNEWHILPSGKQGADSFEATIEIPKSATTGDIILVKITANYPETEIRPARSLEFYQFIHIDKEDKK